MSTGDRGGTAGFGIDLPLWSYPLTQFKAVFHYLLLALWPHSRIFEHGTFWARRASDVVPYALVVLPLIAATVYGLARAMRPGGAAWRVGGFIGAWFFLILAPTALTPGTMQNNERAHYNTAVACEHLGTDAERHERLHPDFIQAQQQLAELRRQTRQ